MLKLIKQVSCIKRQHIVRHVSATSNLRDRVESKDMDSVKKFIPVYKLPHIRVLATLCKLKVYQTGFTSLVVPAAIAAHMFNLTTIDTIVFVTVLSIVTWLPLYTVTFPFRRFIGFIYYYPEEDMVRVAFIDSWGRRKEIDIPRKDVMPLNDLPVSFTDGLFQTFRRFSTKDTLKINLKFGIVLNDEMFKKALMAY